MLTIVCLFACPRASSPASEFETKPAATSQTLSTSVNSYTLSSSAVVTPDGRFENARIVKAFKSIQRFKSKIKCDPPHYRFLNEWSERETPEEAQSIKLVVYLKQPDRVLQRISRDEFQSVLENQWVEPPSDTLPTTTKEGWIGVRETDYKDGIKLDDSGDYFVEDKENLGRPQVIALFPGGQLKEASGRGGIEEGGICDENEETLGSFKKMPLLEIDISSFRRPDMNSNTLFNPNLLAAFKIAAKEFMDRIEEERRETIASLEEDRLRRSREGSGTEQASSLKQSNIAKRK
ncbi:unnamed protein product [Linum tenue]|uniref:Uncharacterized protein n=1 Tax=Linum tenue TaxID=586396 RepID=A0AAV0ME51_9ROSI|nr:unnamed protein product [Linum tenue]